MINKNGTIQTKEFNEIFTSIEKVGNVLIDNGMATNFSMQDYLKIPLNLNIAQTDVLEIFLNFKLTDWSDITSPATGLIGSDTFPKIQIYKYKLNRGGYSTTGTHAFNLEENITLKFVYTNSTLTIYYLNEDVFIQDYSFSFTTSFIDNLYLGSYPITTTSLRYIVGELYLNKFIMTLNGNQYYISYINTSIGNSFISANNFYEI